jgi:hypothetical protein
MRRVYRNDEAEPISEEKQENRLFQNPTDYTQITDAGTVARINEGPRSLLRGPSF